MNIQKPHEYKNGENRDFNTLESRPEDEMTNIRLFLVLIAFVATMTSTSGLMGGTNNLQSMDYGFFCGRKLARVLADICTDETLAKRAEGTGSMYNSILTSYYKHQDMLPPLGQLGQPWLPPHKAQIGLPNKGKRHVVSECCDNACSIDELMDYC